MTAKFGQARRGAFLAALRETGNQTLAAERAKVSRSWVSLHKAKDPAFRQAVDEAVAQAKAALRERGRADDAAARDGRDGGSNRPPRGWGFLDGEELVVRGTGGSGGGKRVQVARARLRQWTPRVEERFLATLAATCNVGAACAEVGLTPASAYNHRNRWPRFARHWDTAIETAWARLEAGLVEAAANLFSGEEPADPAPLFGMTTDQAIHLLHMHKHGVHGFGKRSGRMDRPPDMEKVRASILRKIEAIERMDERRLERDKAEWRRRASPPPPPRSSSSSSSGSD